MVDLLGSAGLLSMLSIARNSFSTQSRGPMASLKSAQYSGISKGRPGFPKPLSSGGRIGLSASSRAALNSFLSSTQASGNALFSAGAEANASIENLQTQIKAIRAGLNNSQLAPSLRATEEETEGVDIEV